MVEKTQKGNQMLVESMDMIHEISFFLEEKHTNTQESMLDKQLNYYRNKDQIINDIQICMVKAITSVIKIVSLVCTQNTTNANKPLIENLQGIAFDKKKLIED
jgi:hypothetical protein